MKANPEKCHLLMSANRSANIKIGEHTISNSYCEKLLGVQIDSELNFNNHLETIIKKGSQKLHVLIRITLYRCISKRKLLINAFFKAQFSDCPFLWVCHSRLMNNKINRLHNRCLRIIYDNKTSSFTDLLAKDGSVTINTRNIHKNMSTELMLGLFCVR